MYFRQVSGRGHRTNEAMRISAELLATQLSANTERLSFLLLIQASPSSGIVGSIQYPLNLTVEYMFVCFVA